MIKRNSILSCVLTVVLVAYLCFALPATADMARDDKVAGLVVYGADDSKSGFVSRLDISRECGDLAQRIDTMRRCNVDLAALERTLRASDKIESVNVCFLNNGALAIDVVPMVPVARVFDGNSSYYINAAGKRITADVRYHVDVPVVVGHFTDDRPAKRLLPLLGYIASEPAVDALVSTVKQNRRGDIIIVPTIRGHVINFGDTSLVADKFARLRSFYRQVMPVKGWNYYDTLAVKWRNRVVATRRNKALGDLPLEAVYEEYDAFDDADTRTGGIENDSILFPKKKH